MKISKVPGRRKLSTAGLFATSDILSAVFRIKTASGTKGFQLGLPISLPRFTLCFLLSSGTSIT